MTTTKTDYEAQAQAFLDKFGLTFQAEYIGPQCPKFCEPHKEGVKMLPCGGIHGGRYNITLSGNRRRVSFEFSNSYADEYGPGDAQWLLVNKVPRFGMPIGERWTVNTPLVDRRCMPSQRGTSGSRRVPVVRNKVIAKPPTAYGVLACISHDTYCPDTFEEWASDYGYDTDSRKAEAMYRECAAFALKLRQFFTTDEITDLQEIQ